MQKKNANIFKILNKNEIIFFVALFIILITSVTFIAIYKQPIETTLNKNSLSQVNKNGLTAYYLNVGQGDCSFITFNDGTTMLIDSGTKSSESFVVDSLFDIYNGKPLIIDYALLTHSDEDHSGGMLKILQVFQINNIFRPRIYDNYNNSTIDSNRDYINTNANRLMLQSSYYHSLVQAMYNEPNCNVFFTDQDVCNEKLNFNSNFSFNFFSPSSNFYSEQTNDYSPIFSLSYLNKTLMFTGDCSKVSQTSIVNNSNINKVDVLKVSHHGSKYNLSEPFIQKIMPTYSVISVGKNNYKHPSSEVVNYLTQINSKIYRTDKNGTIVANINEGQLLLFCLTDGKINISVMYIIIGIIYGCAFTVYSVIKVSYRKNKHQK